MNKRTFLIPSLLVAGFAPPASVAAAEETASAVSADALATRELDRGAVLFRQDRPVLLAGHSSHRSHSSHSSHRSSSSSGGYYPPAPVYSPPRLPAPAPSPPVQRAKPRTFGQPLNLLGGEVDAFTEVVRQVQRGLKAFGYFEGQVTGTLGADTKAALTRLQTDYDLKVTGTITPEVLDALRFSP